MKIYNIKWLICLALVSIVAGCKKTDGYNIVVSTDKTKPGVVTNVKVSNFNGGSYITYTLPDSKNILYVKARYKINDNDYRETKSSYYSDSVMVSGFAKKQDYQVTLWTVSRADVKSDSIVVTVQPDTPPYRKVLPTVEMSADFSGVHIMALNPLRAAVGVITVTPDAKGQLQIVNQNYTTQDTIQYSLRGYDTTSRQFGIYITDKWGNISDTVFSNIKPLYESQMDKSKFQPFVLNTDVPTGFGWVIQNIWDGNNGSPGYHTTQPIQPLVWPAVITFDMGQTAKLSRYTIWDRAIDGSGNWLWQAGAPLTWVLWGRASTPVDETMPDADHIPSVGSVTANGWVNLGFFRLPDKPSKLPNPQYTGEDLAFWNAGFSYDFDINLPKVRYIRFECLQNVSLTNNFFNIAEMTFFGDAR